MKIVLLLGGKRLARAQKTVDSGLKELQND